MRTDIIETKASLISKRKEEKEQKTHIEFSKKWLIACMSITVFFTLLSYILAIFDKNTVSEVSVAIIQTLWSTSGVSFGGYVMQNCVRAVTSKLNFNKNNTTVEQQETNNTAVKEEELTSNIVNEYGGGDDYDYR